MTVELLHAHHFTKHNKLPILQRIMAGEEGGRRRGRNRSNCVGEGLGAQVRMTHMLCCAGPAAALMLCYSCGSLACQKKHSKAENNLLLLQCTAMTVGMLSGALNIMGVQGYLELQSLIIHTGDQCGAATDDACNDATVWLLTCVHYDNEQHDELPSGLLQNYLQGASSCTACSVCGTTHRRHRTR